MILNIQHCFPRVQNVLIEPPNDKLRQLFLTERNLSNKLLTELPENPIYAQYSSIHLSPSLSSPITQQSLLFNECSNIETIQIDDHCCPGLSSFYLLDKPNLVSICIGSHCFDFQGSGDYYFSLQNLPRLQRLQIGKKSFLNVNAFMLKNLPSLTEVSIGKFSFSAEGYNNCACTFYDLPKLKELSFSSSSFHNYCFIRLTDLPLLQSLVFGKSTFCCKQQNLAFQIKSLPALQSLVFRSRSFAYNHSLYLSGFPELKEVVFEANTFTEKNGKNECVIQKCPQLVSLQFTGSSFTYGRQLVLSGMLLLLLLLLLLLSNLYRGRPIERIDFYQ